MSTIPIAKVFIEGFNNLDILSFTHFHNVDGKGKLGARLTFIDPNGTFEQQFFHRFKDAYAAAEEFAPKGDSQNPEDVRDRAYVKDIFGSGGGGGGDVKKLQVSLKYGYPGNMSDTLVMYIAKGRLRYNQGVKEITLELLYGNQPPKLEEQEKAFGSEGTAGVGAITVAGKSDSFRIDNENAVDVHTPMKQAYLRFCKGVYNYDNIIVLIPDISIAMNERLGDKQEIIDGRSGGDKDRRGIARQILEELYGELGAELCAIFSRNTNSKSIPMGSAQAIEHFSEIEGGKDDQENRDRIQGELENFVSISATTHPTHRWKELDKKMKEIIANISRMVMNKHVSEWGYHVESAASNLGRLAGAGNCDASKPILVIGDQGMIDTMRGYGNKAGIFAPADRGLANAITPKGASFKMNMGDQSNILDLEFKQENWYLHMAGQLSLNKAVKSVATVHTPGKFKEENHVKPAMTGSGNRLGETIPDSIAKRTVAEGGAAKIILDDTKGDGSGNHTKTLIDKVNGGGKFAILKIKTLPMFEISNGIGGAASVQGREVRFAGEPHSTQTPFYVRNYNILGFKHTIDSGGPVSEFYLVPRG